MLTCALQYFTGVDLKKYWLMVDDDGTGIKEADLPLVGQRYHTSKCQQLEDLTSKVTSYGFRGEVRVPSGQRQHNLSAAG